MNIYLQLISACALITLYVIILRHWHRGFQFALYYIPLSGIPVLMSNYNSAAILFKDIAFVLPAYISFFCFFREKGSFEGIPRAFVGLIYIHILVVILQMFNPAVPNFMVALIGAKVWLFHIPLMLLSYYFISSRARIVELLRPVVVLAWIPCLVGLMQWIGSTIFGYETTMTFFYGAAGRAATQEYAYFQFGADFYRIPSTFSFAAQYASFLWSALVVSYILMNLDPSPKWRIFAKGTFGLAIVASFLCGAREAYIFIPLFIGITFWLHRGVVGGIKMCLLMIVLWVGIEFASSLNIMAVLANAQELVYMYTHEIGHEQIRHSVSIAPLGLGTGLNTGAARFAFGNAPSDFLYKVENYYGKTIVELGLPGAFFFVVWQLVLVAVALRGTLHIKSRRLRGAFAALAAFFICIMINNIKAFKMDIDPLNIYYWVFAGFVFRFNSLIVTELRQAKLVSEADFLPMEIPASAKDSHLASKQTDDVWR